MCSIAIYWSGMFYVQQQRPEDRETLLSQQQPPTSSLAIPSTTQHQPTSPPQSRQQTRIGTPLLISDTWTYTCMHNHAYMHSHTHHTHMHTQSCHILTRVLFTDKRPTLKELVILKYTEDGKEKKLHIIKEASHKWKDIASVISDDSNKIKILEQQHPGNPHECLRQTFIDDFIDKEPEDYSQDWRGLIELFDDVDLKTLAEKIKHALHVQCHRL